MTLTESKNYCTVQLQQSKLPQKQKEASQKINRTKEQNKTQFARMKGE